MNATPSPPPINLGETLTFAEGEYIFRQGDRADTAFMVLTGRITVHQQIDGRSVPLDDVGPGQMFGEMVLLGSSRRMSTAIAATGCLVARVSTRSFSYILEDSDRFIQAFVRMVVSNIRNSHRFFLRRPRSLRDHLQQMRTFSGNIHRYCGALGDLPVAAEMRGVLGLLDGALAELEKIESRCPEKRRDTVLGIEDLQGVGLDAVISSDSRR